MQKMFKVVSQSLPVTIQTQNGQMQKSTVVLQEVGGKYADSYVCTLLGNQLKLYPNDFVCASLRFSAREYNGSNYMDCTIQEIVSFTQH